MDTLFFCSIMLKSWRRSGAMFLSRKYSGLFSSTLSKYRSLCGAVVGGGEVTTAARESPFMAQSFSVPTESTYKKVLCLNHCPTAFHHKHISLANTAFSVRTSGVTESEPSRARYLCGLGGTHQPISHPSTDQRHFCPLHCSLADNRKTSSQSYCILSQTEKELDTEFF